ncbi:hypothetical protein D0865_05481 [Hortaea werneckii]|uniref:Stress-response A/B barrel domain-containing protein n=1 Tax=Hortaea werneckii TaxID=91943 RepID=A0A3M7CMX1_HORWE|nr:hypothetical protein D0865_05481 [Hortaea werneckii]
MTVIHIVFFKFTAGLPSKEVADVCSRMIALSQKCIHPQTMRPYFKSLGGGRDNSPEGQQGGFTHGFVCEFRSVEDRDYYVSQDVVHQDFVKSLEGKTKNVRALDFEPGKF